MDHGVVYTSTADTSTLTLTLLYDLEFQSHARYHYDSHLQKLRSKVSRFKDRGNNKQTSGRT